MFSERFISKKLRNPRPGWGAWPLIFSVVDYDKT